MKSSSLAKDLLVYLGIFPAFIRAYDAVIAVILSPEIKRDGKRDTSAERDTSYPITV